MTLRVTMAAEDCRAAERVAKRHAPDGLAGVLAAFASDVAKSDGEPGAWAENLAAVWLLTRPWPRGGRKEGV